MGLYGGLPIMPLNKKGRKIKAAMKKQYGAKKGEQVFYASENKGTFEADASLSDSWWSDGVYTIAMEMPAVWTAADMTVQASMDGGVTWKDVYDTAGNEWKAICGAGHFCRLRTDRPWLGGMKHLRLRSGTAAAPVAQAAQRIITVVCGY